MFTTPTPTVTLTSTITLTPTSSATPTRTPTLTRTPTATLLPAPTFSLYKTLTINTNVWRLEWSPDARSLLVLPYSGKSQVWDITSGKTWPPLNAYFGTWSPNGKFLALDNGSEVKVMNGTASEIIKSWKVDSHISDLDWLPDNDTLIVTTGGDDRIVAYSAQTGQAKYTVTASKAWGDLYFTEISPGGRFLAALGKGLFIWDISAKKESKVYPDARTMAWVDDNAFYADTASRINAYIVGQNGGPIVDLKLSPAIGPEMLDTTSDNRLLAAATGSEVTVLDIRRREIVKKLPGHNANVIPVQFSPGNRYLAYGGNDKLVSIYEINYSNAAVAPTPAASLPSSLVKKNNSGVFLDIPFELYNLSAPQKIDPFLFTGKIMSTYDSPHSTLFSWEVVEKEGKIALNVIPNGNPAVEKSTIISSVMLSPTFDVSTVSEVVLSMLVKSTSNPRPAAVHNCDSSLNAWVILDSTEPKNSMSFCGSNPADNPTWRTISVNIKTQGAKTLRIGFDYQVQNIPRGDPNAYYLIADLILREK